MNSDPPEIGITWIGVVVGIASIAASIAAAE